MAIYILREIMNNFNRMRSQLRYYIIYWERFRNEKMWARTPLEMSKFFARFRLFKLTLGNDVITLVISTIIVRRLRNSRRKIY